jgi:hypothetical protein
LNLFYSVAIRLPVFPGFLADRAGVVQERRVVGKPSVDSDGRRAIEPGEESQFLHVVGETIGHGDGRRKTSAQRIAHFEVALAARLLADVAPCRNWIVTERIVHPFRHFVRHDGDVGNGAHEDVAGIVVGRRKSLRAVHAAMEAENAARRVWSQRSAAGSFAHLRLTAVLFAVLFFLLDLKSELWVHRAASTPHKRDQLLSPIALYPDSLLSQIMTAKESQKLRVNPKRAPDRR